MTGPILFINPNSSTLVTDGIRTVLDAMRPANGPEFEVIDIPESPATIATAEDVARSGLRLAQIAQSRPDCSAFVSACFSDPGVELTRSLVTQPVFGMQECGILAALARADLFGIIALGPVAVARHRLRIRQMGVEARMVAELPLNNASAASVGHSDQVFADTMALGQMLKERGAGALVLGCAGFAPRRAALESALGIAVIDPVQAAAGMALAAS
ncbi:aspartate/glutamate racemase family protein [Roseovarius sp. ZX-A-9]|uniref:aspartate/glutamate racemase family protein n=1 Tax=Roseovarius sp. ZX-A-9 TaxID=3014783 RepID=UPI00232E34B5|nr:aspartate/glutamate racemase family protein [Roseovarius sp. ZX-A-9]